VGGELTNEDCKITILPQILGLTLASRAIAS